MDTRDDTCKVGVCQKHFGQALSIHIRMLALVSYTLCATLPSQELLFVNTRLVHS